DSVVRAVQRDQSAVARTEIRGQVGDLLVGQGLGLARHQRVFAVAVAVRLQRMPDVVGVLAADRRVGRVDRCVAFGAMAVDAGLTGGLALGAGRFFAGGDVAVGQAGRR